MVRGVSIRPRVAVDTNVLIAGIIWPRWPYEALQHGLRGDCLLVLSPMVIAEARNRFRRSFPEFLDQFQAFLELAEYELTPTPARSQVQANLDLVRQERDVPVALSIIAADVDYFVTYDRDFTDQDETTAEVCKAIPGIMLPPVFLREVMGWSSRAEPQSKPQSNRSGCGSGQAL